MSNEEAIIVLGNLPVYPDDCYCVTEYQEAKTMAIKALEQEPCEDCISRKAVEKIINKWLSHPDYELKDSIYDMTKKIHKLPSVTPQSKTGHWITHEEKFNTLGIAVKGGVKCSECGYTTHNTLHMELGCPFKFCPNCGAKMIDLQESEDMEEIDFIQPKKTVGMLISIDVLDKIKSEIEHEKIQYPPSAGYYKAIMKVLQIIDKYKVESEE